LKNSRLTLGIVVVCFVALNVGLFIRFGLQSRDPISPNTSPVQTTSIAIKPLTNLGAQEDSPDLGSEMTESLWRTFTENPSLRVSPISSLITYKDTPKSPQKMGEELKVSAVVEGSVERAGENLKITLQLIETSTGRSLWASNYTGELSQWPTLRESIPQAAGASIRPLLEAAGRAPRRLGNPITHDDRRIIEGVLVNATASWSARDGAERSHRFCIRY
jgi:TolB-like protein